ncbi:MAG: twin-arginine translocation signal domain-containing protein [Chloroflexi bacterium]|nr:twin-arginine translocation signal domain-containing protein [Chloroflexota bacterium]
MPKDQSEPKSARQSRRSFLGKLGLALAGMAGASFLLSSLGRRANKDASSLTQEFPDEDSIFHPARDPRLDPRRNRSG